jgi:glucokinase
MGRWGSLGIDLGGTKVLAVLFDEKFKVVAQELHRTQPDRGLTRFTRKLSASVSKLAREAKRRGIPIRAVGAGCAGFVDAESGLLTSSPNVPFIRDFPLCATLKRLTGIAPSIGNDVQLGLYGEQAFGSARGCRNAIALFLGTGIGGAIIIDGRLHRGSSGLAGEIGHYLLDALGPLSGSQRHGLLDDVASRHAIAAQAAALAAKQWAPHLFREAGADLLEIRADALARAIKRGDEKIEELVRSRSAILGIVMANLVNFLSPDLVVMGGGMVKSLGKIIVPEAERAMRRHALPPIAKPVRVAAAQLGDLAVAAGAAKWAVDAAALAPGGS